MLILSLGFRLFTCQTPVCCDPDGEYIKQERDI